jgi:hypothetical protein
MLMNTTVIERLSAALNRKDRTDEQIPEENAISHTAYHRGTYPMKKTLLATDCGIKTRLTILGLVVGLLISLPPSVHAATSSGLTVSVNNTTTDPSNLPLIQLADLKYIGAFRVPQGNIGASSFDYGGTSLAYNPANDSLFMVGSVNKQMTGEFKIPQIVNSSVLADLETATVLQPFTEQTEGRRTSFYVTGTPNHIGGYLVYKDKLLGTLFNTYDANNGQITSHYLSSLNLSMLGDVEGPYRLTDSVSQTLKARFFATYLGTIPTIWQSVLGGTVLTGECCTNISGGTSNGPGVFAFDPADLGTKDPVLAAPLHYYPASNPLGFANKTNNLWNGSTKVAGVMFPENSRSVLFFGQHGVGQYCYGNGGIVSPPNATVQFCYDPVQSAKGSHSYPYGRTMLTIPRPSEKARSNPGKSGRTAYGILNCLSKASAMGFRARLMMRKIIEFLSPRPESTALCLLSVSSVSEEPGCRSFLQLL